VLCAPIKEQERRANRGFGRLGFVDDFSFLFLALGLFFFSLEDATLTLIVAGMQSVLLNDQFPVAIAVAVAFHLPNGIN